MWISEADIFCGGNAEPFQAFMLESYVKKLYLLRTFMGIFLGREFCTHYMDDYGTKKKLLLYNYIIKWI